MDGSVEEVVFELLVGWAVDADAGVPLGLAATLGGDRAASVGDGIAFEADRVSAAVADLVSLLLFKGMVAFSDQKQEPVSVADVLHVGEPTTFAIGTVTFADVDAVLGDQLCVELERIFVGFDPASDIEPVTVAKVADGDLLN